MPGELPGHHGPLHSARPGSHLCRLSRASLTPGSPRTLAATWPVPVPCSGKMCQLLLACGTAWRGTAWHGMAQRSTAQLSWGCTEPKAEQQHLCASLRSSSSGSSPQEGGDVGGFTLGWSVPGTGARTGSLGPTSSPGEDLNPCPCLGRQPLHCLSPPCGCCHCSCSWGSAASGPGWCPQVSTGWARGPCGTGLREDLRPHVKG